MKIDLFFLEHINVETKKKNLKVFTSREVDNL